LKTSEEFDIVQVLFPRFT